MLTPNPSLERMGFSCRPLLRWRRMIRVLIFRSARRELIDRMMSILCMPCAVTFVFRSFEVNMATIR